nr:hypothetical protein [Acinetobacter oleivorans]
MELELSAGVLDRQIDNLKDEISEGCFDDNMLDELIDMAIKLGEVYAQRDALEKAKAQAVPEGYVLLPRVPTEKMFQAYARYSVAPMSTLSKTGYKAMVEASESGAEG